MTHAQRPTMTPVPPETPRCDTVEALGLPVYEAQHLTQGGAQALIRLQDQVYMLRITRNGKLILTK